MKPAHSHVFRGLNAALCSSYFRQSCSVNVDEEKKSWFAQKHPVLIKGQCYLNVNNWQVQVKDIQEFIIESLQLVRKVFKINFESSFSGSKKKYCFRKSTALCTLLLSLTLICKGFIFYFFILFLLLSLSLPLVLFHHEIRREDVLRLRELLSCPTICAGTARPCAPTGVWGILAVLWVVFTAS